jgi:pyruvate dehydrogenase phosphatase
MLIRQSPSNLAYLHNIPGSRCGPEDGPWPRPFRALQDADIWRELSALARPQTWNFETSNTLKQVECVNFQPCSRVYTQDRYLVQKLEINGKHWLLTGVFDGEFLVLLFYVFVPFSFFT